MQLKFARTESIALSENNTKIVEMTKETRDFSL